MSPAIAQEPRLLRIATPLGPDVLVLQRLTVRERISEPFLVEAEVLSERDDLAPGDLIGQAVTCTVRRELRPPRHFHGLVRTFVRLSAYGRKLAAYRLEVVPRLWQLSRTSDCRIFQNEAVRRIVEALLGEAGAMPVRFGAAVPTMPRPYCVQYNETDLDFVQRLLDELGCGYFFQHTANDHTLFVAGANADFPLVPGEPLTIRPEGELVEALTEWQAQHRQQPGQVAALDYDMLRPSQLLHASLSTVLGTPQPESWELFHWPGGQAVRPDADPARLRMETSEADALTLRAQGTDPGVFAGGRLRVKRDQDIAAAQTFLIAEAVHEAFDETHLAGGSGAGYRVGLALSPVERAWRPPAPRSRPVMPGLQSAVVTGPAGEEIHCDDYGRVKVHFLWDRKGKTDDTSSCWVRIAQPWAGAWGGAWFLPRIGDEVLVGFVDGDPDKPVIIGSLHNAEAPPPFKLIDNRTQSGILTRSSKGGAPANHNMLRFEDKKGAEEVTLHAERDLVAEVKRDSTETIRRNQASTVTQNRSATIEQGNDSLEVRQGNIGIKASFGAITIEAMQSITLKVGQSTVVIDQTGVTVKGPMVTLQAQAMLQAKAPMVEENADGMMMLKGGIVMIN